jgi:hypothetical protein
MSAPKSLATSSLAARLGEVVGRGVPTAPPRMCRIGTGAVGTPRPTFAKDLGVSVKNKAESGKLYFLTQKYNFESTFDTQVSFIKENEFMAKILWLRK